jgi:hypothetical protein
MQRRSQDFTWHVDAVDVVSVQFLQQVIINLGVLLKCHGSQPFFWLVVLALIRLER